MLKVTAPVRIDISAGWPDSDPYRKDFGGVVLNAAIDLRVSAVFDGNNIITSLNNVPFGGGLGASGAVRATYLVASNPNLLKDRSDLIKRVHKFENEVIGYRAGFQDEAAAIFGGVNYWEFGSNDSIKRQSIDQKTAQDLEDHLVLVYTGQNHLSPNIHDLVFGVENYERNIPTLDKMKISAKEMFHILQRGSLSNMEDMINETWELQKSLHSSIEIPIMKQIQESAARGKYSFPSYSAIRATGAGSGGCMIFYTNDKNNLIEIIKKLEKSIQGIKYIPFKFDFEGIRIET